MKKIKTYKGWTIYEASNNDDKLSFENCNFGLFLPDQSPREMCYPEFCSDNVVELIDFVNSY